MKRQWWHNKIAYQIYPKSFLDTNGDGIGDIPGIIRKLDYLKDLGVDILWLSPIYVSPYADQGYDIADYYNIDPDFGTMEDMDALLREAHARGMYILMDLVVNHCSDEHEWFKKACEDPEGQYGRYFYIENLENGKVPCNWRSYFGGSVWEPLPGHPDKVYLHVFHKKQPDLNWENPMLREEIYRMINWWLDRGLDGFRLDAIINIKKALPFHDYPADRDDGLSSVHNMLHEADGVGEFLAEMRDRTFAPHRAFTVGEVFNEKPGELPLFIGENGYFCSMFDFAETVFGQSQKGWHESFDITPDDYKRCVFETQKKAGGVGFISNIIENHDEPRGVSRYIPEGDLTETSKKLLATVYFLVKGLPWIYQGQELGMENLKIDSIDEVDDISSIDAYKVALDSGVSPADALRLVEKYGRDNARTPMQWDASENAGFTAGTPWLRVNPNYLQINLEAEAQMEDSVYCYYKKLIALRKDERYEEALVWGGLTPYLEERHNVMAYLRVAKEDGGFADSGSRGAECAADGPHGGSDSRNRDRARTVLVIANYQREPQTLPLPASIRRVLLSNLADVSFTDSEISLSGYQAVVAELEDRPNQL